MRHARCIAPLFDASYYIDMSMPPSRRRSVQSQQPTLNRRSVVQNPSCKRCGHPKLEHVEGADFCQHEEPSAYPGLIPGTLCPCNEYVAPPSLER